MTSLVRTEAHDGVAVITLDRPRANVFNPQLVAELSAAISESSDATAVVLASSQALFSAGWALRTVRTLSRPDMARFLSDYSALVRRIFSLGPPVVAALPGHAIAGGLIVAIAADERIAAEGNGELGLSEVPLGVPIPRSCYELFRYVLGDRGAERVAAGDNVGVTRAREIGLVDQVVPAEKVLEVSVDRARQLGARSRSAYGEIKRQGRAQALARFDAASAGDPFLDFWFSDEARRRIDALVDRLTKKA